MFFLASGIFVFDEIFGVRFFKKQELCHFEPLQKVKNPYFKVQTRTLILWILRLTPQYDKAGQYDRIYKYNGGGGGGGF